ncbi:hypothetical protein K2X33_07210 [bacterium]|nr:hypothetical protein [bacterium]
MSFLISRSALLVALLLPAVSMGDPLECETELLFKSIERNYEDIKKRGLTPALAAKALLPLLLETADSGTALALETLQAGVAKHSPLREISTRTRTVHVMSPKDEFFPFLLAITYSKLTVDRKMLLAEVLLEYAFEQYEIPISEEDSRGGSRTAYNNRKRQWQTWLISFSAATPNFYRSYTKFGGKLLGE